MDATDRRRRAAEEAAEWWVLLQADGATRAQREQYVDWLRESAVHVAEMLRVAQVHGALAQFDRWNQVPTEGSPEAVGTVVSLSSGHLSSGPSAPPGGPSKPMPRRSMLMWATAASLLAVAGLGALRFLSASGQIIQTERGERREMALTDGSVVQVDPETRLRLDYQPDTRRVILERGRALFHVARNANRPFLVQAHETTVRAVGTAFAVEQGTDAVVVTVAEGKVAVLPAGAPEGAKAVSASAGTADSSAAAQPGSAQASRTVSPRAAGGGHAPTEILLTANEQVTVAGSGTAAPVREVDSSRALAWAEGRLVFENESVARAVEQFNRYNRIQLTVNDADLAHRSISGVFNAADPESFVAFIQSVAAVRVTRDNAADVRIEAAK
jgi:transmembrane sensor